MTVSDMISLKIFFMVNMGHHLHCKDRAVAWLWKRSPCVVLYDVLEVNVEAFGRDQGGSSRRLSTQTGLDIACSGYQSIRQGSRST